MQLILADDHILIRKSLAHLLESMDQTIVAEATNADELLAQARDCQHDIILSDYRMPGTAIFDVFHNIKQIKPASKIIAITGLESLSIIRSLVDCQDIDGILLKSISTDHLMDALHQVFQGQHYIDPDITQLLGNTGHTLTKREIEIASLLAQGFGNDEIAQKLVISKRTIENHRHNIMQKLEVNNIVQLIKKIESLGIVPLE